MRGERLRYLPQRLPLSMQLAHQRDHFRHFLSVGEAPASTAACRDLALARRSQLGNQVRLLKLADGPKDLPHEHCGRGVGREEIRRARRHQLDPERAQIVVPRGLHTEIARKAVPSRQPQEMFGWL
jgi:hypothetical protein